MAKPVNGAQGCAQVVRYRITKGFRVPCWRSPIARRAASILVQLLDIRLDQFPLGGIADGGADQDFAFDLQRTEADLHWELGAVLPQAEQVQPRSHRADVALIVVCGTMPDVTLSEALRHQNFDGIADQFGTLKGEHLFRLRIDQLDDAVLIHHHHGIRRAIRAGRGILPRRVCVPWHRESRQWRYTSPWNSRGLRLISTGNSLPSLCNPNNPRPLPIGRTRGSEKYPVRCFPCLPWYLAGMRSSMDLPSSSFLSRPKSFSSWELTRMTVPSSSISTIASGAASRRRRKLSSFAVNLVFNWPP